MKKKLISLLVILSMMVPLFTPLTVSAETLPEVESLPVVEEAAGAEETLREDVSPISDYTIIFDSRGGIIEGLSRVTTEQGKLTLLPTASKEGFNFLGWSKNPSEASELITSETVFTEDTTLYAMWEAVVVEVAPVAEVMSTAAIAPASYTGSETFTSYFAPFNKYFSAINGAGTTAWVLWDYEGGTVLKSGMEGKKYSSGTITLECIRAGQLSFDYKVSSEAKYDYFSIKKNGTDLSNAKTLSGEIPWTTFSVSLQAGDKIELTYSKDSGGDVGSDCVYLKNFYVGSPNTITFHGNNETSDTSTQEIFGKGTLLPNTFTKTDAVFIGWGESAVGPVVYGDSDSIEVSSDMDLYAIWSSAFTVTFDYNDTITSATKVKVAENTSLTEAKIPIPKRTGYTFLGWYNGESKLTSATSIKSNTTYTASWEKNNYTIILNANGGTGESLEIKAAYDESLTLPTNNFARKGYSFKEWGTSSSGGTKYEDKSKVMNLTSTPNGTVTLYAQWVGDQVEVDYNLNYETENKVTSRKSVFGSSYNYIYDEVSGGAKYSAVANPTRSGYIFDGWFTEAEGGALVSVSANVSTAEKHTLYAHWSESIRIHFNGGLYTTSIANKTVKKSAVFTNLPTISSWSYPTGHNLVGWFTEAQGGKQVTENSLFTEDEITLYARWVPNTYTINFNANGGEGSMESITGTYGVSFPLPLNKFTYDGYKFKGWTTSTWGTTVSHTDGKVVTNLSTSNNGNVNLYALWEQTTFGLAFSTIDKSIETYKTVQALPTTLPLSTTGTGYTTTWTSSDTDYILPSGEVVKLPDQGKIEVTVTAEVTETSTMETATKSYLITLYSKTAMADEAYLKGVVTSLTDAWYTPRPTFGTDTNVASMLEEKLISLNSAYSDVTVTVKETVATDYARIASDGMISYYYKDPNTTGATNFSSLPVVYLLTRNGVTVEWKKNTIVHWDQDKVKEVMGDEILSGVTEDVILDENIKDYVTSDLVLPMYVDGKKWCEVSWTSLNTNVIKVSDKNQQTPATMFDPYVGTVIRGANDQTVVLTAKFSFNFSTGNEAPVTLYKTFTVKVPAMSSEDKDKIQKDLLSKIDAGVAKAGFRDFSTGELFPKDGNTYVISNDIQYPVTSDFGVDGKYFPVTITSSNEDSIAGTTVANAARSYVYRDLSGENDKLVDITLTITDKEKNVSASRTYTFKVLAFEENEIEDALKLMEKVKANYFEGMSKGRYQDVYSVTGNLSPFKEAVETVDGSLLWIYDVRDMKDSGIISDEITGWEEQEAWRAFRSSDPMILDSETLNYVQPKEDTFVRINSSLSHATLGKYWDKFSGVAGYEDFEALYRQPVNEYVMVHGTNHVNRTPEELAELRKQAIAGIEAPLSATLILKDFEKIPVTQRSMQMMARKAPTSAVASGGNLLNITVDNIEAGTTVFGLFRKVMNDNGYTYSAIGSYVRAITDSNGITLAERDGGPNSGWIYKVNGSMPQTYMNGYTLKQGDVVEIKYTRDYTQESGNSIPEKPIETPTPSNPAKPETSQGLGSGAEGNSRTSEVSSASNPLDSASILPTKTKDTEKSTPETESKETPVSGSIDTSYVKLNTEQNEASENSNLVIILVVATAAFLIVSSVVYAKLKKKNQ